MAAWPRAFLYQKGLLGVAVVALCALGGAIVDDTLSFIPDVSVGCNLEITSGSVQRFLSWLCGSVISYVEQEYHRARSGQVCVGDMVKMLAICGLIQACRQWKRDQSASPQESGATTRLQKAVEKSVDGTTRSNRNFISNVSGEWVIAVIGRHRAFLVYSYCRCKQNRSRSVEEILYPQVLFDSFCNLSLNSHLLPRSSTSR